MDKIADFVSKCVYIVFVVCFMLVMVGFTYVLVKLCFGF